MICSATVETVAQHKGEKVVFCGTPSHVSTAKKADGPVFLDFGVDPQESTFKVVIFSDVAGPDRDALVKRFKGKALRLRGVVTEYKGAPEVILKSMDDIEVD